MSKVLELTKELIKKPSVTPLDEGCQDLIASRLKKLGFKINHLAFGEVQEAWASTINFSDFMKNDKNNCLVAGTIMSIQEKKSAKGNPFAIIKYLNENFNEKANFKTKEASINIKKPDWIKN